MNPWQTQYLFHASVVPYPQDYHRQSVRPEELSTHRSNRCIHPTYRVCILSTTQDGTEHYLQTFQIDNFLLRIILLMHLFAEHFLGGQSCAASRI